MKKLIIFLPIIFLCFSFFSCVDGCDYQTPVCFFCRYGDEKIEGYYIRDYQNEDDCIYLSETEDYPQLNFSWKLKTGESVTNSLYGGTYNDSLYYYIFNHFYEWDNIKIHDADLLNSSVLTISYYLSENEVITLDSSAIKDWGKAPFYCTVDFLNKTFTLGTPGK